MTVYPADVVLFEGILAFYSQEVRDLFRMKLFVDTDADTRLSRRGEARTCLVQQGQKCHLTDLGSWSQRQVTVTRAELELAQSCAAASKEPGSFSSPVQHVT